MTALRKAYLLPSREGGLALVQIQALACGCPIVVGDRTGGADLKAYLDRVCAVSSAALRRAMVEDRFCFAMFSRRGNRPRLEQLISDPQNRSYELAGDDTWTLGP